MIQETTMTLANVTERYVHVILSVIDSLGIYLFYIKQAHNFHSCGGFIPISLFNCVYEYLDISSIINCSIDIQANCGNTHDVRGLLLTQL